MLEEAKLAWKLGMQEPPEDIVPDVVTKLSPYLETLSEEMGPIDPLMGDALRAKAIGAPPRGFFSGEEVLRLMELP